MKFIERVVNDIYYESKIEFQLIVDGVGVYSSPAFKTQRKYLSKRSEYKGIKYTFIIGDEYINTINLLTGLLESRLDKIIVKKEDLLLFLLSEKNIDDEVVEVIWSELNKSFKIINIYLSEYSSEIYDDIKELYLNSTIEVILYNNNILIIGNIDDTLKDAEIIKEKIDKFYFKSYYITYCNVYNYNDLKIAYDKTFKALQLAIKYRIKEVIFDDKKLVLEEVIDSMPEEIKNEIVKDFDSKIAKLDKEMLKTIEVFFNCGLNLSEAAKELYIHRNTLIYRLDKIQKITSYDVRQFNDAMIFKIIFLYIGRKSNLIVEKV